MRGNISWQAVLVFSMAVATMVALPAGAASLTWDANGTDPNVGDGAGTWLDADQWWDGGANVTWNNSAPDNAIIGSGGAGGNISLGTVTAGTVLLDNFTGTYTLKDGSLDTSGGITIGPDAGNVNLPLSISGAGGITVNAPVRVNLRDGGKTFSGDLVINAGEVLDYQFNDLGTGNLRLNGGVLVGYWGETMSRTLGTGPGEVQVPGGVSGFSGQGANGSSVRFNNDDNYEVVWGSAEFNPSALVLQSPWANYNGKLTWRNKLDLNGAQRTIAVNKDHEGRLDGYAQMINVIRNSDGNNPAGITKTGPGRLILTSTDNSYDGPTIVNEGILQIGTGWTNSQSIPGGITPSAPGPGSNLVVNDAMIAVWYHFSRPLGTGGTEVQFTGGVAGITQRQGDRPTFNFGSTSTEVVWGTPSFNPDVFVINDVNAGPATSLRWDNPVDLNGADRTIGTYSDVHGATMAKNIRNTAGTAAGLVKTGAGTLTLSATNTYDGGSTINQGKLHFTKLVSMPASGNVAVNDGTTLVINLGGSGEWTAGASGNGTLGGLFAGLGGQSGSTVSYTGNVTLGIVPSGSLTLTSAVGDVGTSLGIDHAGSGTLELAGNNTYSGDTVVTGGGALILSGDNSGAAGDMRISNGYLNVGADMAGATAGQVRFESNGTDPAILQASGTLDVTTGSGGDVYWPGSAGGFAATDSALTVTFNGGVDASWRGYPGFGGDNKPQLGSPTSTAPVTVTNNLSTGWSDSIRLFDNPNSSADISILAGDITDHSAHTHSINGSGTLWLQGTNDLKTGTLQLNNGVILRAVDGVGLPTAAKLYFNNGVLESSGTFTRDIDNSAGNVYWNNNGGFAAYGGALNVNLEGGVDLDWSSSTVGFNNKGTLYLGSPTADNVVTLQNNIALNGDRTITVNDNPDSSADYAVISGSISDGSGNRNLTKNGSGTLLLNGDNTYTGDTIINAGTLVIDGDGAAAFGAVTVKSDATLGGDGTIGGAVTVEAGGSLLWDFDGATGTTLDLLDSLQLDSGWELTLSGTGSPSGNYTLLTFDSFSGTFEDPANMDYGATGWSDASVALVGNAIMLSFGSNGDADGDGDVDAADYIALKTNMGQATGATQAEGDFDGDGDVDWYDLQILQDNYGAGSAASGTIPEPATLGLLAFGALAVIRRRRG